MKASKGKQYPVHKIFFVGEKCVRGTKQGAFGGSAFDAEQAKLRKFNEQERKERNLYGRQKD